MQTCAAVAQVVIAGVAVYYTARTAWATRDTVFLQSVVTSLNEVRSRASAVRAAYRGMFLRFSVVAEKAEARGAWLRQREEVSTLLGELAELLPEIAPVWDAWKVVEREEDTHATGDALALPPAAAINRAHYRYEDEHRKFVQCMGKVLRSLR